MPLQQYCQGLTLLTALVTVLPTWMYMLGTLRLGATYWSSPALLL